MSTQSSDVPDDIDAELEELHRKFRMLESERKSYTEESQNTLRKQRVFMEKLKKENEYLKEQLVHVEEQNVERSVTQSTTIATSRLQDQIDGLNKQAEQERRKLEDLTRSEHVLRERVVQHRQDLGGVNAVHDTSLSVVRQIRSLENRLDLALNKFSESLTQNQILRGHIDTLRKERVAFEGLFRKLERQLLERKREMAEMIEVSNVSYEQRDEAQNRIIHLKEKADREIAAFEAEVRELNKIIEQDRKMKDFLNSRDMADRFGEDKKKRRTKLVWEFTNPMAASLIATERVPSFEAGFAKIQAATGIMDINEFATTFIRVEDQNFSTFNYVNEMNVEIEKVERQVSDIKAEIEKFKSQGVNTDSQRKKVLKDLEDRLQRTDAKADMYDARYAAIMKTFSTIRQNIQHTFNRLGCSTLVGPEVFGGAGVTEANVTQYLGMIEHKVSEILQIHSAIQTHPTEISAATPSVAGHSHGPTTGPTTPQGVALPSIQSNANPHQHSNTNTNANPNANPNANVHPNQLQIHIHTHSPQGQPQPQTQSQPQSKSPPRGSAFASVYANLPSATDDPDSDDDYTVEEDEVPFSQEELRMQTIKKISKQEAAGAPKKGRGRREPTGSASGYGRHKPARRPFANPITVPQPFSAATSALASPATSTAHTNDDEFP